MATQWQTFPIEFKGGLISNLSPLQHGVNAVGSATILQNFEPTKEGGYAKIRGYEKWSDSQIPGTGPVLGVKVVNESEVLAVRSDGSVSVAYHSSGGAWVSKLAMPNNGGKVRFAELNFGTGHKVIMVDGTNYPAVFDDSSNTITQITGTTDVLGAQHVAVYNNMVFYSKGTMLYYTALDTYDSFSAADGAGFLSIGHQITGLAVFRDQLIVFCRNSIQRVTGTSYADINSSSITDRIGCINGDTIQEVGGDIMYASPDGIRLLSATDRIGDFGLDIASDPVARDASNLIQASDNFTSIVLREKAQYRIFSYIPSEQDTAARGLIATKFISQGAAGIAWATTKGIKAYCSDSKYTESYSETTVFANDDGYVYELEVGSSFDGDTIEAIYESPYMPLSDPQIRKTFYKMTLYAEPTGTMSLDVNLKYDFAKGSSTSVVQPNTITISSTGTAFFLFGETGSTFGTATFGGELDQVYNTNVVGSGKTVALRIEDKTTNPTFTLDTAILEFRQFDRQ